MKVAVFSDVQGNLPPMLTVFEHILDWSPDLVIMNGDLVNRGPDSLHCLDVFEAMRVRHGWIALRGNHEDFVLECTDASQPPTNEAEREMQQFTVWTSRQLGAKAELLRAWREHYRFHPVTDSRAPVAAMHGSRLGNRHGILPWSTEEELAQRIPPGLAVFLTAHTHRPLIRPFQGCAIVNSGSAGSPFDGDVRASYARLVFRKGQWESSIVRLDYDRALTERAYHETGFLEEGGPIARLIHAEWKHATSLMPRWRKQYLAAIQEGKISVDKAANEFLATL